LRLILKLPTLDVLSVLSVVFFVAFAPEGLLVEIIVVMMIV